MKDLFGGDAKDRKGKGEVEEEDEEEEGKGKKTLTNIFISKLMRKPNSLRLVLHRTAVYNSLFELFLDRPVNGVTLGSALAIFPFSKSPKL